MLGIFLGLNWLGVLVGVVICFVLGAVWFHPKVLGSIWMAGRGKTAKDFKNRSSLASKLMHLLGLTATAILVAYLVAQPGYQLGVLMLVLSSAFSIAAGMMFELQGKLKIWSIVAGHKAVCVVIFTLCTTLIGER